MLQDSGTQDRYAEHNCQSDGPSKVQSQSSASAIKVFLAVICKPGCSDHQTSLWHNFLEVHWKAFLAAADIMGFSANVPSAVCQHLQPTKISPFPMLLHWHFAAVCMHRRPSSISTNSPPALASASAGPGINISRTWHQHQHLLMLQNCTNITSGNREVLVAIEAESMCHLCTRFRSLHGAHQAELKVYLARPCRAQA